MRVFKSCYRDNKVRSVTGWPGRRGGIGAKRRWTINARLRFAGNLPQNNKNPKKRHFRARGSKATERIRTVDLRFTKPQDDSLTKATPTDCGEQPQDPSNTPGSCADMRESDPELASVAEAWPKLPEHIKSAITTMVESSKGAD